MRPLVSIIMPMYNAEKYVSIAIDSVLAQTYGSWELIVIDDCSQDSSCQIVSRYAEKDERIHLFHTLSPSGGPATPRNIGIENSTGKYIAFLDSDDIWMPEKLTNQILFAESNKYDVVYSYYEKMLEDGSRKNRIIRTASSYDYKALLKTDGIPWLTLLLSRNAIGDIRFNKDSKKEDYVFILEILRNGYTAHNTRKIEALYRESMSSRSGNKYRMIFSQWKVLREHEHLGMVHATYCLIHYLIFGLRKYLI